MTLEEFQKIRGKNQTLITAKDLVNKENRTLLHGYTLERDTFDVELVNGEIVVEVNEFEKGLRIITPSCNSDYVPSKRVYPAQSDFEFCRLLLERGVYIPFTFFD
jgi:hypothetical protein